ncbi:MAG: family transcriptional regulator, cyclic receptor protein [Solirubrobacteraceae bacterium]|nr:family transcriptional regulator, cyclic receptor protein [Solirubrobacteraceae bacterium]
MTAPASPSKTSGDATPTAGFLAALDPAARKALYERGTRRSFRRGTTLFHEGGGSDRIVVVLSGRVKVSTVTEDGKEIVLAFRGPGDLLGELSAIDGEPRSATVSALEPVDALVVAASDFRSFLAAHPPVALLLLQMLSRRLRDADRKRVEYGAYDTLGRVAARLVELADRFGEPVARGLRITLPLSQEELAGWTGASREAVSKALQALRGLDWVITERRRITVLDIEALRRRSA